jgi:hypothetical protein
MVKMANIHAEGITNLYDYNQGRMQGYHEVVGMLERAVKGNPDLNLIPAEMALRVLIASIKMEIEDADIPADSNN